MNRPNPYTQRELAEARKVPPRNEPFSAINVSFHETYTRLVEQVLAQLGDSVPVIVLIGDDAKLLCDGREHREQFIPARYHELKALGHLAFGVQLTLMANGSGRLSDVTVSELHGKRAQIEEIQAIINASQGGASRSPTMKAPDELLCRARALSTESSKKVRSISIGSRTTSAHLPHTRSRLQNWPCASSSNNCRRSSYGGAMILARSVGLVCTS